MSFIAQNFHFTPVLATLNHCRFLHLLYDGEHTDLRIDARDPGSPTLPGKPLNAQSWSTGNA